MPNQKSVALLAAGRISSSFLLSLPNVVERLGPIVSTSLRLASRYSNLLKAGRPVDDLAEVDACELILISAANPEVFVERMLASQVKWKGKVLLLCGGNQGSEVLLRLKESGALVASLTPVEGGDEKLLVSEGCAGAIKHARDLLRSDGVRLMRINSHQKQLYSAAVSFGSSLALPLIAATAETLRACGLQPLQAIEVAVRLVQRSMRTYRKAGRNGWEGDLARRDVAAIERQIAALAKASGPLEEYFVSTAAASLRLFKQDTTWLENLVLRRKPQARAAGA